MALDPNQSLKFVPGLAAVRRSPLLVSIRKRKRLNFLLNYNKREEASTCFCYHEQSSH
jgi:hypothetical protein